MLGRGPESVSSFHVSPNRLLMPSEGPGVPSQGDKPQRGVEGAGGKGNHGGSRGVPATGAASRGAGPRDAPSAQAAPQPPGTFASASSGESSNKVTATAF